MSSIAVRLRPFIACGQNVEKVRTSCCVALAPFGDGEALRETREQDSADRIARSPAQKMLRFIEQKRRAVAFDTANDCRCGIALRLEHGPHKVLTTNKGDRSIVPSVSSPHIGEASLPLPRAYPRRCRIAPS